MSNHIIEYIGKTGVRTAKDPHKRFKTPMHGDVVIFGKNKGYPFEYEYGRIERVNWCGIDGLAHVCVGGASVFLNDDATVSISGGPFETILMEDLEPTYSLQSVGFWNWGDNWPGAGMGVNYTIARPVFRLRLQGEESKTKIQALWDAAKIQWDKEEKEAIEARKAQDATLREFTQAYESNWTETTEEWYEDMLEVLPPERWEGGCFMVGEPTTHGERGAVHAAYAKINNRFFCKDDYVIDFNPKQYKEEIKQQFNIA